MDFLKELFVPISRAGWPFIALFAAAAAGLALVSQPLGWLGAVMTLWCVYFFRDPDRVTPVRDGIIVSPADGVVRSTEAAVPPPELKMGDGARSRVSIFMNVFNVHVNRVPADGRIALLAYRPGRFFNASLDKASEFNERQGVKMIIEGGRELAFVQIAGLIARRIECDLSADQEVRAGERFGLIRFGSRVDVYLPDGVQLLAVTGQLTVAGETVIAEFDAREAVRGGEAG